jgi:hypothetical protein
MKGTACLGISQCSTNAEICPVLTNATSCGLFGPLALDPPGCPQSEFHTYYLNGALVDAKDFTVDGVSYYLDLSGQSLNAGDEIVLEATNPCEDGTNLLLAYETTVREALSDDYDGDGVDNDGDSCPDGISGVVNYSFQDIDDDGCKTFEDADDDGDGIPDVDDACPLVHSSASGDFCDPYPFKAFCEVDGAWVVCPDNSAVTADAPAVYIDFSAFALPSGCSNASIEGVYYLNDQLIDVENSPDFSHPTTLSDLGFSQFHLIAAPGALVAGDELVLELTWWCGSGVTYYLRTTVQ